MHTDLAALSRGFRNGYLDHAELTAQVKAWAAAFPHLVRLTALCTSAEGREQWLLTIGPDPDRARPSVWVDGNMHASELAGSSVALAIAEDVIRLHLGEDVHGLSAPVRERLRDVLFHVLPRMSPDGAEAVLKTGRYVRSNPRDARREQLAPKWIAHDVDGDGVAMVMRVRDDGGEFVESKEVPGLLLPRTIDDAGPFWKVWPEGTIVGFDGRHVPDPYFLADNDTDLNRNFPWGWAPEPEQAGAGRYPTSEPESRSVVEFATEHPELFAWLNLHTFGGVYIRPRGDAPDNKMDASDLALYRQIGAWAEEITTYPMVSGFEEFTYEPDKPLRGDLVEWAYAHRGCVAYVCELWDIFARIGQKRPKRFVDHYTNLTRDDLVNLGKWDRDLNQSRVVRPWKPVRHEQLGDVEVGGIDPRVGLWNPPPDELPEVCRHQSAHWLRVASLAPALRVSVEKVALGDGVTALDVTVENVGYLPTNVLSSARSLPHNEEPWLEATGDGVRVDDPRRRIGHLDGWGRGLFDGSGALYYLRSRGSNHRRIERIVVHGSGVVTLRAGSCRTGFVERRVEV
jgi:hypothetical protein